MTNLETRFHKASGLEVRKAEDTGTLSIAGLGIVYDKLSQDLGGWVERIDPVATNKTLGDGAGNVYATFNHNDDQILGRVRSKTLTLSDSKEGLNYEVELDSDNPVHIHVASVVGRGDVDGSSFTFRIVGPDGAEWDELPDGRIVRVVKELALYEIGPVVNPAYLDTNSSSRSVLSGLASAKGVDIEEVVRCAREGNLRDIVRASVEDLGIDRSDSNEPGNHSDTDAARLRLARARLVAIEKGIRSSR